MLPTTLALSMYGMLYSYWGILSSVVWEHHPTLVASKKWTRQNLDIWATFAHNLKVSKTQTLRIYGILHLYWDILTSVAGDPTQLWLGVNSSSVSGEPQANTIFLRLSWVSLSRSSSSCNRIVASLLFPHLAVHPFTYSTKSLLIWPWNYGLVFLAQQDDAIVLLSECKYDPIQSTSPIQHTYHVTQRKRSNYIWHIAIQLVAIWTYFSESPQFVWFRHLKVYQGGVRLIFDFR